MPEGNPHQGPEGNPEPRLQAGAAVAAQDGNMFKLDDPIFEFLFNEFFRLNGRIAEISAFLEEVTLRV